MVIAPNPSRGQTNVMFELMASAKVHIGVANIEGSIILSKDLGGLGAGYQHATLDLNQLASGIYFVTLEEDFGGGRIERTTRKLCLIK